MAVTASYEASCGTDSWASKRPVQGSGAGGGPSKSDCIDGVRPAGRAAWHPDEVQLAATPSQRLTRNGAELFHTSVMDQLREQNSHIVVNLALRHGA
jgi:hypothetical protein